MCTYDTGACATVGWYAHISLYLNRLTLTTPKVSLEDQGELRKEFPPLNGKSVPMGDVFTSCNWVLRDGLGQPYHSATHTHQIFSAPKTATKRVFLITDEDNPHAGAGYRQLTTSARTTLIVGVVFIADAE